MNKKEEALKEMSKAVALMFATGDFTKKEILEAVDIGEQAFKFANKQKKKKVVKISGNNKKDLIKQVKRLELDQEIEEELLNVIDSL